MLRHTAVSRAALASLTRTQGEGSISSAGRGVGWPGWEASFSLRLSLRGCGSAQHTRPTELDHAALHRSAAGGVVQAAAPSPLRQHVRRRCSPKALPATAAESTPLPSERPAPGLYLGVPEAAAGGRPSMRPWSGGGGSPATLSLPSLAAPLLASAAVLAGLPAPAAALSLQGAVGGLEELIQSAGLLGPVIFVAAYVAATVLLVPGSLLTLAAGFLFGPVLGTAVVSVASTAGASAAFLVGRYLARPAVERRIEGNTKFAAVDAAIGRQGPKIVFLLRLSPLFPFTPLNYALSLTKVEFGPYVLASWAGMLPGTVAYVALGGAGKAAAETAAGGGAGPVQLALYALGAGATLWVAALISKAASKALEEASASEEGAAAAEPLRSADE